MIKYTKEVMQEALENAYSIAEVCRNLNLKPVGGNYNTIHKYCKLYDIDLSHLTGQNWKVNFNLVECKNSDSLEKMLQENTNVHSSHLREKLIASKLKINVCEVCGCGDSWQNKPITLQLHHVNGDHFDNRIENLQILCPNCHSQAEGHKKPKTQTKGAQTAFKKHIHELKQCVCKYCGKTFTADRIDRTRKFCSQNCYREYIKNRNENQMLLIQLEKSKDKKEMLETSLKIIGNCVNDKGLYERNVNKLTTLIFDMQCDKILVEEELMIKIIDFFRKLLDPYYLTYEEQQEIVGKIMKKIRES